MPPLRSALQKQMIIKTAEFVISNTKLSLCPAPDRAEYAFIGRSNVGKSSLINYITGNKKLAKTSGTPGKTQLINHFMINDEWYMVDLPGYGYAKTSKTNRHKWETFISEYILQRNWAYYKNLFMVDGTSYRNDYAFAMANLILDGYSLNSKNIIPWKMFTVVQEVVRIDANLNDKIIIRLKDFALTLPKHNVHIMDKNFLVSDNSEEFVKEILDV